MLTFRQLSVMVRHLPSDSALVREQRGDAAEWSTDTYLLAAVVDLLRGANWQRGAGKGQQPKPIERPGDKPRTAYGKVKPVASQASVRAFLDSLKPAEVTTDGS